MAHRLVADCLREGEVAIDATAGNGHDTQFLAEAVGPAGTVYALDIQAQAIEATRGRLEEAGTHRRVKLIEAGHEKLSGLIDPAQRGQVGVVMFNLGYLPGGDKSVTTHWESSISGLRQSFPLLRADGLITAVCYPGHPAGAEEANAVERFLRTLDQVDYRVIRYGFENVVNAPPFLLAVEKV